MLPCTWIVRAEVERGLLCGAAEASVSCGGDGPKWGLRDWDVLLARLTERRFFTFATPRSRQSDHLNDLAAPVAKR